jgi:hypothetical protein
MTECDNPELAEVGKTFNGRLFIQPFAHEKANCLERGWFVAAEP